MERNFKRNPNGERNRKNNNWRIGVESLEQALEQFEPMVHKRVNYYAKGVLTKNNCLLDEEDLCQVGRMAIVVAYQTFNPKFEAQLSTWVHHKIGYAILEYIKKNYSSLKGGEYVLNHVRALEKNGETVTVENVVKKGVSRATASTITYLRAACRPDTYGVGHTMNFYDIESGTTESFEGDTRSSAGGIDKVDGFHLEDFKKYLTESEFFALKNYYGVDCDRMTMQEIGERLGKSRKATSYMINRALNKLRHVEGIEAYAPLAQ